MLEPTGENITTEIIDQVLTIESVPLEPTGEIIDQVLTSEPVPLEPSIEILDQVLTTEPVPLERVLSEPTIEIIDQVLTTELAPMLIPEPARPLIPEPVLTQEPTIEIINQVLTEEPAPALTTEPAQTPESVIPSIVFIVPYRDREKHYNIFSPTMKIALLNGPPYKIFYVHQTDSRGFNRGAMKNIGFLVVKNMYPNDYQNITLVFNDIDTMPSKDTVLNYQTSRGIIKHFYGFDYTLGGIVSINASNFEILNGFPNFWSWGYEDNLLQTRAKNAGILIDRSVFYKIHDPRITYLSDTPIREVNRADFDRFLQNTTEGIQSIRDLKYSVNEETGFIDVLQFDTTVQEVAETRRDYDLRNGPAPFKDPVMRSRRAPRMKMHF